MELPVPALHGPNIPQPHYCSIPSPAHYPHLTSNPLLPTQPHLRNGVQVQDMQNCVEEVVPEPSNGVPYHAVYSFVLLLYIPKKKTYLAFSLEN